MISYIRGVIEQKREGYVVIDNNGMGYEVFVSNNTLSQLPMQNEEAKILTYLQVKEDGLALFGFASNEERELFLKLISISGIGPKNALAVLSGFSISDLIIAIASGNVKMLCKIKGLGAKTAERIVLELRDKVECLGSGEEFREDLNESVIEDATDTLISLGISKNDAYKWAKSCATATSTVEEIITNVLKGMGR